MLWRKRPHLKTRKGVHAPPPENPSENCPGSGVESVALWQQPPGLSRNAITGAVGASLRTDGGGFDVAQQIPDLAGDSGAAGRAIHGSGLGNGAVLRWFSDLQVRLRRVRVVCGDWARVVTPAVTYGIGLTGVFLDPPYSAEAGRDKYIYSSEDLEVAHVVRAWCVENGDNPALRIALCGYQGEHDELEAIGWEVHAWRAQGGYANQNQSGRGMNNRTRERIWFSPHCIKGQGQLFA